MFENLTQRLSDTVQRLRGKNRLSDANISEAVREVKIALLEADVALPVVQAFVQKVKTRAVGQEVLRSLTPGKTFVGIVNQELVSVMGSNNAELNLAVQPPAVFLLAGLQGSGKTTTAGKLAKLLKDTHKKRVMVVSCDVYRPAAIEQLKVLAGQVGATFFASTPDQKPVDIARAAVAQAKRELIDVLIVDTAGRLAIDTVMMEEVRLLHGELKPIETLFVVDSMTGQDAANTAKAFSDALPLTGVILTKTDGDARGGAALSVRYLTGRPIKFIGRGEKVDALEVFHPDRIASRILGMGDVLSLVEQVAGQVDQEKAERLTKKVLSGKGFDFNDMKDQMEQLKSLGGLSSLLDKLPINLGQGKLPMADIKERMNDKLIGKTVGIINSMTPAERRDPDVLNASRKARIARGAGVQIGDINMLVKQIDEMRRMMKKMGGKGVKGMLKNFQRRIPAGKPQPPR